MRLISRHILRTMAAPFLWGVVALTGLMLLNALPPLIEAFGGKGIPASVMIEGVLLFVPALLALTLPMAVLVAVLYGYSQLAAQLEMVAMYANGISVWRMARPALIGGTVVALINFMVFDQLMPQSNARFAQLRNAVVKKNPTLALRQQVLNVIPGPYGQPSGYVIRADAIAQETGAMRGVTIFDMGTEYGTRRLITADSGDMAMSVNGRDLILTLHSGQIYEFKRDEPGRLQQTKYQHSIVAVRNVQNDLEVSDRAQFGGRSEKEMTSCELLDGITREEWKGARANETGEYLTRHDLRALAGLPPVMQPPEQAQPKVVPHCGAYRRFENWIKGIMLPQPLAAQSPATQVPQGQQSPATQGIPGPQPPAQQLPQGQQPVPPAVVQPPTAQQFLVAPNPQGFGVLSDPNAVLSNGYSVGAARSATLIYAVEYHQKFAVPLACFCFVLIGMALALKFPGSGIGLVIGGSLVIFLGFYIMLQGTKGVAQAGNLDPALAMYAPVVLFTLIGLFAVNSADREMGTARSSGVMDSVLEFFQRFRR